MAQENYFKQQWAGFTQAPEAITSWDSGEDVQLLRYIGNKSVSYPETFVSKIQRHYELFL